MHARIVCIGNRLFAPDSAGPQVYDLLSELALPACVELVDGGLGGLNLLPFLERTDMVVFIDAVTGFAKAPGLVLVDPREFDLPAGGYDHDAGLAYLLQAAPHVLDHPLPEIRLVGIEGSPTPELCRQAASACLDLITLSLRKPPRSPALGSTGGRHG
jgi:hydrogenase maturation protease